MTPPRPVPMEKLELIHRSRRILHFGLPALLPVLGLPFAIVVFLQHTQIKHRCGPQWNPAQSSVFWGLTCARIGTAITLCLGVLSVLSLALLLLE